MKGTEISVPFALFIDDGVHIFQSLTVAETWLEVDSVRGETEWVGYDSAGSSLAIEVAREGRFERVRIKPQKAAMTILLNSYSKRYQLIEYLLSLAPDEGEALDDLPTQVLLDRLFEKKHEQ